MNQEIVLYKEGNEVARLPLEGTSIEQLSTSQERYDHISSLYEDVKWEWYTIVVDGKYVGYTKAGLIIGQPHDPTKMVHVDEATLQVVGTVDIPTGEDGTYKADPTTVENPPVKGPKPVDPTTDGELPTAPPSTGMNFGGAIMAMESGMAVARRSWGNQFFIFKQVEANINPDIIPNMQSIPDSVKAIFQKRKDEGSAFGLKYVNEIVIVNPLNEITYFNIQGADAFAKDWYVV